MCLGVCLSFSYRIVHSKWILLIRSNKMRSSRIRYQAMPLSRFTNLCYYFITKKNTTNASTTLLALTVAIFDMDTNKKSLHLYGRAVFLYCWNSVHMCIPDSWLGKKTISSWSRRTLAAVPSFYVSDDEYSNELRIIIIFFSLTHFDRVGQRTVLTK